MVKESRTCSSDVVCFWTPSDYNKISVQLFGMATDSLRNVSTRKEDLAFLSGCLLDFAVFALRLAEPLVQRTWLVA